MTDARSSGRSEREGDKSLQTEESIASILMEHNTTRRRKISVGDRRPHRLSMMVRSLPALEGLLFKRKDDSLYEQPSPASPKHKKVQNRGKWSTPKGLLTFCVFLFVFVVFVHFVIGYRGSAYKPAEELLSKARTNRLFLLSPRNPSRRTQEPNRAAQKLVIIRSIGNALPPRHNPNQTITNLKFILENEKRDDNLFLRHWVVNRLVDPSIEDRVLEMLNSAQESYTRLPFSLRAYESIPYDWINFSEFLGKDFIHEKNYSEWTHGAADLDEDMPRWKQKTMMDTLPLPFRERMLYLTNQNAARNFMVDVGKNLGPTWILPLDGNCYFHPSGFQQMVRELDAMPEDVRYVLLPMARLIGDNSESLDADFYQEPVEEPQLIMRHDAEARFDTRLSYGRRDKVALFIRLGVPGPWTKWKWYAWEKEITPKWNDPSITDIDHSKEIPRAGWVMRLSSGVPHLEEEGKLAGRGAARFYSMKKIVNTLDRRAGAELHDWTPKKLLFFNLETMKREKKEFQNPTEDNVALRKIIKELVSVGSKNIVHGPWSVTDKPKGFLPPSADPHDYYHPAPYWHPATEEDLRETQQNVAYSYKDGVEVAYIRKDGVRISGTELYSLYSERYDRSRLQAMFSNVTVWTLASFYSDDSRFAEHAAECVRVWFIRNETRMNPHLMYAQYVPGKSLSPYGLIEFKDVYFFMDALRLLEGHFSNQEVSQLQDWFSAYLKWFDESRQGMLEHISKNNHGIYYDIQKASIAAYVNRQDMFYSTMYECVSRLHRHVDENGLLPEELARPNCEHYQVFTLSGWYTMSRMASSIGLNYFDPKIASAKRRPNSWDFRASLGDWNEGPSLLCHAMEKTNPLSSARPICKGDTGDVRLEGRIDEKRWWPLTTALRRHCNVTSFTPSRWIENQTFPKSAYDMPSLYFEHYGIAPFWNLGTPGHAE